MYWESVCRAAAQNWPFRPTAAGEKELRMQVLLPLTRTIQDYFRVRDLDNAERAMASLFSLEPFCALEPLRSAYELVLMQTLLVLADLAVHDRDFTEAYRLLAQQGLLLNSGDKRRAAQGRPKRANSELRWVACQILALAKWTGEEGARDRLLTPAQVRLRWQRAVQTATPNLHLFKEQERVARLRLGMAVAGLEVAKMSLRFEGPLRAAAVLRAVNGLCEWGVSVGGEKPAAPEYHWYDWEVARRWIKGELTQQSLEALHRERALRTAEAEAETPGLALINEAELSWMFTQLRRTDLRLEAV